MKINLDKIIVLDDIQEWLVEYGKTDFSNYRYYPFHYGDTAKSELGWLFGAMLFDNRQGGWYHGNPEFVRTLNEYFMKHVLKTIDSTAVLRDLTRIRVNGMNTGNVASLHNDSPKPNMWAMLYYVYDSTGATEFYHGDGSIAASVEPKAGRIVVFPACYMHKANSPTELSDWRVTLNYNYLIEGDLNNDLFTD